MKTTITKNDWLMAQQCPGMAWYALRMDPPVPDEAARFRMQQGQEVGARARELFPGGVLIPGGQSEIAAELTQQQIKESGMPTFFEAAVLAPPFTARADVLTKMSDGWHVVEVKSNLTDTKEIKDLKDDLAYTVMVFERAGLPVRRASLALLTRDYRLGDEVERLFELMDETSDVLSRANEWAATADASVQTVFSETPPSPRLASACRECLAFDRCLGNGLAHTVLELPGLHHTRLKRLSDAGTVDLRLVPDNFDLNEKQQRAKQSALSNKLVVAQGLTKALAEVRWPCRYLDFETVATTLPLYPEHGCHEQLLTQFSVHHRAAIDAELRHSEYLADASRDCEKELAEALIGALAQDGSIMVYSGFEKTRITALRSRFPDLAGPLDAILGRLVDLLAPIREYVYHPDFRGKFSIKAVLPALVPDLSYKNLAIGNGDAAITAFARMARGEIALDAVETTRRQLLEYCAMDTFAMVRLHEELTKLAS